MVHECLKHGWCIAEAKEHYGGFKESEGGDECCLPLICLLDMNVIVSPLDVELGEESGILHVIYEFRDEG